MPVTAERILQIAVEDRAAFLCQLQALTGEQQIDRKARAGGKALLLQLELLLNRLLADADQIEQFVLADHIDVGIDPLKDCVLGR